MLEIDRQTGEPTLLKLVAVDDAGNLINPMIVEGQIHGGLAQGIGQAMIEEVVYSEDGQLLTGSFMDYAIPRAIDFPRFELDATVTPTPVNPLGAKGVGEAGTLGSTPCIVDAAVDALSEFGVKHIDMMLRPEKLWRLIQAGHAAGGGRDLDGIRIQPRHVARRRAGEAGGEQRRRQVHRRRPQPGPAHEASPQRAEDADRHRADPGLSGIREKDGKIEIGAGTVHHDVASSALLRQVCPAIAECAAEIGDPQVRNRGTLGGSLAHADPAADYPAVMLALDAEIHAKGPKGWRVVKAQDFFQGLFTVDLAADEILVGVQFTPCRLCGVRQTPSARIALRHRRRRGSARGEEWLDSVGPHRAHRRGLACDPADRRGAGARGTAGVGRHDRCRRAAGRREARRPQLGYPCQRGVSPCDGRGLHQAGIDAGAGASSLIAGHASFARRHSKKRSSIIFATPPIRRWPTRAIGPLGSTEALTSTAVVAASARRTTSEDAFTDPGRPCPSASRPYDVFSTMSISSTTPV